MTTHPYAELFPMMPDAELRVLAEDIKANGLEHKIVTDRQGRLVDGRNRRKACEMAGVEPAVEARDFADEAAILRFVLSSNLHRRHLSESQRAMVAASIANMNRGDNRHTRDDVEQATSLISQGEAAAAMDVHRATVSKAAKVIKQGTTELQQAVRQGDIPVSAAAKIAALPPPEQAKAIAERKEKPARKRADEPGLKAGAEESAPEAEPAAPKKSGPRQGVHRANEAIDRLRLIAKDDELREVGFKMVINYIQANQ